MFQRFTAGLALATGALLGTALLPAQPVPGAWVPSTSVAEAATAIPVKVDGRRLSFDSPPILYQNRTMVPIRQVAEALGAKVEYWAGRVNVSKDGITLSFFAGSSSFSINGVQGWSDVPTMMRNGRTLVPIRLVSETLGAKVGWNSSFAGVDITSYERLTAPLRSPDYVFPLSGSGYEPYINSWGQIRSYSPTGGIRRHEGIDIMAATGTPIRAAAGGVVARYGWNELGGYRLNIKVDGTDFYMYYAHMDRYNPAVKPGGRVEAGQIIGYVGSTGYGPEGTRGKFAPHLHFGLYRGGTDGEPTNPYPLLKIWQSDKW